LRKIHPNNTVQKIERYIITRVLAILVKLTAELKSQFPRIVNNHKIKRRNKSFFMSRFSFNCFFLSVKIKRLIKIIEKRSLQKTTSREEKSFSFAVLTKYHSKE